VLFLIREVDFRAIFVGYYFVLFFGPILFFLKQTIHKNHPYQACFYEMRWHWVSQRIVSECTSAESFSLFGLIAIFRGRFTVAVYI